MSAQNRACSGYAMARKGTMKWTYTLRVAILLQGKQQNTTFSVNHELKLSLLKLGHGAKKCHKMDTLLLVVKVVQVVFYVSTSNHSIF